MTGSGRMDGVGKLDINPHPHGFSKTKAKKKRRHTSKWMMTQKTKEIWPILGVGRKASMNSYFYLLTKFYLRVNL